MKKLTGWAVSWLLMILGDAFLLFGGVTPCRALYQASKDVQSWGGKGPWFFVARRLK